MVSHSYLPFIYPFLQGPSFQNEFRVEGLDYEFGHTDLEQGPSWG